MTGTVDEPANVVAGFVHACDHGTIEAYAGFLAADVEVTLVRGDEVIDRRTGRDAVVAATRERRRAGALGPGSGRQHLLSASWETARDDDAVRLVTHWMLVSPGAVEGAGHYVDDLERAGVGWRLRRRTTRLLDGGRP